MKNIITILVVNVLCVLCFTAKGQIIMTIAGNGTGGFTGDGGLAIYGELDYPYSISSDVPGNLLIPDPGNVRVRQVSIYGRLSTMAGNGSYGYTGDGGPATAAEVGWIAGSAVDIYGNIYLGSYESNIIRKVDTFGIITTFAGTGTRSYGGDGGPATAAQLSYPYGVATDGHGNVYIADYGNYRIRKVNTAGIITTVAGTGTYGFSGDGGPATAAEIASPLGIAADTAGNLYIPDDGNFRVRKVNTSGIITTVCGTGGGGFYGDGGPATAADMSWCYAVAVDKIGNLYVGDLGNNRIRKVDTSGIINTICGNGTPGFSGDLGPATAAEINSPTGVSVDGLGNVYIADNGNNRIRMISNGNHPPHFTHGHRFNMTMCVDTSAVVIDTELAVVDTDYWQTEIWHTVLAPSHGILLDSFVATSYGGLTLTPNTSSYRLTGGTYSGTDSFKVSVTDGIAFDTITVVVTINPPVFFIGSASMCLGQSETLVDSSSGGVWTSSNTSVATVGTGTGIVNTFATGTSRITYAITATSCAFSALVTVNPMPASITGTGSVCVGDSTTLSDVSPGGAWSSSNLPVATIGSSTGTLHGVAAGTALISYQLLNGCYTTDAATIFNFSAGVITPEPAAVCLGSTVTLSCDSTGGVWSSADPTIGTVSDGGVVTGVSAGHALISYSITNSCGSMSALAMVNVGEAVINTIAGTGGAGNTGDGGAATAAELVPSGICTDLNGYIYISAYGCVRKINSSGIISTIAGNGTSGFSGDGGPATNAELGTSLGICTDRTGNIYIADVDNNRIRMVGTSGTISTICGGGIAGSTGDGGPATAAEIHSLYCVTVDTTGNIYLRDGSTIRWINTAGIIHTIAGNGTAGHSGDGGPATAAEINSPDGLVTDIAGNIYFSEANNHDIRKVSPSSGWIISTIAGDGTFAHSGDGGAATAAAIKNPYGLFFDRAGNLFMAEFEGSTIREINTSGIINTIAGTGSNGFSGDRGPATAAEIFNPTGLSGDYFGNIYFADARNDRVREITLSSYLSVDSIIGPSNVCTGAVIALADSTPSGVWSSDAAGIATVGTGGVVTSVAAGTAVISYTVTFSCNTAVATKTITVSPSPGAITGTFSTCVGATTTLSDGSTGGTWSSNNIGIATVGSTTGLLTGISAGTSLISYTAPTGCYTTATATVISFYPGVVTPEPAIVCPGSMVALTADSSGGTWSSADPSIATVSSGGIVTGITSGHALISYTVPNSCGGSAALAEVTVGALMINTVAGNGTTGYSGDGGPATAAELNGLWGIATDQSGNVYFSDIGNRRIRKINTSGTITTIAGNGTSGFSGDGGPATSAELGAPWGVATDGSGNVYIADNAEGRVRKVTTSGYISTIAGNGTIGYSGDGGPATAASLNSINGIAADAAGNIYIGDTYNYRVRKVSAAGMITTVAGNGGSGYGGDGGAATAAQIGFVNNVAVDNKGNIYVADFFQDRVRIVNPAGIITTFAGNGTAGYSGDGGPATTAEIQGVGGIALDSAGNVYVGDVDNNRIRVINTSGIIITYAGTGSIGFSGDGGPATAAVFNRPNVIAFNTSGNLFVIDLNNDRVREISTQTPGVDTIIGPAAVCVGSNIPLADSTTGGTWSSSTSGVATVGATGIVTGIASGTTIITYTVQFSCGPMIATKSITVNPLPAIIAGTEIACQGATQTLTDVSTGGTWSSNVSLVATIGSHTGTVAGISAGTTIITYSLPTGCWRDTVFTVVDTPSAITGTEIVCAGSSSTLADGVSGGTWSSSNISIAPVVAGSGNVFGLAPGTALITYSIGGRCNTAVIFTVTPLPVPISGGGIVCPGTTATYFESTTGGTWTTSNTLVATIGSLTGTVTGVATGTALISYTLGSGCYTLATVTVSPGPAIVTGTPLMCVGSGTDLFDATAGGTWQSSASSIASVVSSSGVASGVTAGTAIITYKLGSGCYSSVTVTVNPLPPAFTGGSQVCRGQTSALSDAVAGGTWLSSNPSIAAVGSTSGTLTGVLAGTTIITYTLGTGCRTFSSVTVNSAPAAISGITTICVGATSTLTDIAPGGAWSSNNITSIPVGTTTGTIAGLSAGSATITYSLPSGCYITTTTYCTPNPVPISGETTLCTGASATLSDATGSGSWSSSNALIANVVLGSGLLTGVAAGTAVITYTLGTGCNTTATVTIGSSPTAITGPSSLCNGSAITMGDGVTGGAWSSSNTAVAAIGTLTGVLSGVSVGTTVISYSLGGTCVVTQLVSILPAPNAITGALSICAGASTSLADATTGGTWSSAGYTGIAVIGSSTGILHGVSAGTAIISYALPSGCSASAVAAVNNNPPLITGPAAVCSGALVTLADATAGGTWSSSNALIAEVGSVLGTVSGGVAGTVVITYSLPTGCFITKTMTVDPLPAAISGLASLCAGATTVMTDGSSGGAWMSLNPSVGSITSATGVFTGILAGSTIVTYSLATGCLATTTVAVTGAPAIILGPAQVCIGATIGFSDGVTGGTWGSSDIGVAAVDVGSGIVSGIASGSATITYSLGTGCITTTTVTVNPVPATIAGLSALCTGLRTTLTDGTSGGAWTSSNIAVAAIVSGTGVLSAVSAGTSVISYTLPTGCVTTSAFVVAGSPAIITGPSQVCVGASMGLSDAVTGGAWSSSDVTVANIDLTSGIVTGMVTGSAIITYSLGTGCITATTVAVNPLPAPITGLSALCTGLHTTLTDGTTGGLWSSSNPAVAGIIAGTGVLSGVAAGSAIISYTLSTGCLTTNTFVVTGAPDPISGSVPICPGSSITLSDASAGGTWSATSSGIATVGSLSGTVTGIANGTLVITYAIGTGCITSATVSVNPSPAAISGSFALCIGASTTLTDATGGGSWSSSSGAIASITSGSGALEGVAAGTAEITYTLIATGCTATAPVVVYPPPSAIGGATSVCAGSTTTLTTSSAGGTWSCSAATLAIVGSTGVATALHAGTATVTYTLGTGCMASTIVTVIALPPAITGVTQVCLGNTAPLLDAAIGGVWSSGSTGVASITSIGVISGVSPGTAMISYEYGSCYSEALITVDPLPVAIVAPPNGCAGLTSVLTDVSTGGSWSSRDRSIATIGASSGVFTGIAGGVDTITYTLPTGCFTTVSVTVNPTPLPIAGTPNICTGVSVSFTDVVPGGAWSCTPVTVATVSATGRVTAVAVGGAIISYSIAGCAAALPVVVNPLPAPIAGLDSVCEGGFVIHEYDIDTPGHWTSSFVNVDSNGFVSGYGFGIGTITYTLPTGCYVTKPITLNASPSVITGGASYLCIGGDTTFIDAMAGGHWSTATPAIATIGSATGVVTGIATGNAVITYTIPTGCYLTQTVAINPQPLAILGLADLCAGATTIFSDSTSGGTWLSHPTTIATIGAASGTFIALSAGVAVVTYSVTNRCGTATVSKTIAIHALPDPGVISGPTGLCLGYAIAVSETVAGGTWGINNSLASVSAGIVTGVGLGTDTVIYAVENAWCVDTAFYPVTINPVPYAGIITGDSTLCVGAKVTEIDDVSSGHWSAGNTNATVSPGGVVTGAAPGPDTIIYTVSNAWCSADASIAIAVQSLPDAGSISGASALCVGASATLSDPVTGGVWTGTNPAITLTGGLVQAIAAGSASVTYSVANSCGTAIATHTLSIGALPDAGAITGPLNCCAGDSLMLTETVTNGSWMIGNGANCTISSAGQVMGTGAGTDTIDYEVSNSCGTAIAQYEIIIYPSPVQPIVSQTTSAVMVPANYNTYQWYQGGKEIPGATSNAYKFDPYRVYEIKVTNAEGCPAFSQAFTATDCNPDDIGIFPNPASTGINILWCKSVTAIVMTIDGKMIKTVENTYNVELGDLPNGEYMLVMYDVNGNKLKAKQFSKISK